ncbi:hypothetical protein [Streptomyces sp. KHY 26]|uniref:hypothetical protein n=1 Tax=Streptomyces sp. KHY 26 TaxID=3097359 RepID=UPI00376F1043
MNDEAVAALSPYGDLAGPGADLTDPVVVDRLRDIFTAEHADATLLVYAAGVFASGSFLEHTATDYDRRQVSNCAFFFVAQTMARAPSSLSSAVPSLLWPAYSPPSRRLPVGGVLFAFPAILPASLTLVAKEEGLRGARDDASGTRHGSRWRWRRQPGVARWVCRRPRGRSGKRRNRT